MTVPKVLVFGYGNPGRGDDALGPELIDAIEAKALPDVECQIDMQLQVEHVTDLMERERIIFIDADMSCDEPYTLRRLEPEKDDSYTSHAMSPGALLYAYHHVYGTQAPDAYVLSIRGYHFELGDDLSKPARENLSRAIEVAQQFCENPKAITLKSGI